MICQHRKLWNILGVQIHVLGCLAARVFVMIMLMVLVMVPYNRLIFFILSYFYRAIIYPFRMEIGTPA